MPVILEDVPINFAHGLDTKTDPKQVAIGKFIKLVNSVFTKAGLLMKRPGYGALASLPNANSTFLTTFSGNLTALGTTINAYASGNQAWVNKGTFQPLDVSVIPVARSAFNQTQCDSVVASNQLVCTAFTEVNNGTAAYKYVIQDATTGQNIVAPTVIPASGTVSGSPRVFLFGGYFVVAFTTTISATAHLQYIAISISNPSTVSTAADIAAAYIPSGTVSWDGVVVGNKLFFAYNTTAGGQAIKVTYLNSSFIVATPQTFASSIATVMSITADSSNAGAPIIYAAFYDSASQVGKIVAVDQNLNSVLSATQWISSTAVKNVTCTAQDGSCEIAFEVSNAYSYDSNIASNFLDKVNVSQGGTVGSVTTIVRSLGLASKGLLMSGTMYMLATYDGKSTTQAAFQPTYFLISISGTVIARIAYQNGGGYLTTGLPQAQVFGTSVHCAYLYKDLITSVNKTQGISAQAAAGIYSQTGVNLATFGFDSSTLSVSELGSNLNISGGFLYAYDGNTLNEQDFFLYPDSVEATWSASGGSIHAQPDGTTNTNAYFYQVVYEWTDAQGNLFYSAPSIPIGVTTTGSGTSGSITINGPMARLTYKTGIKIGIYRWSVANQVYTKVTSITAPLLNSTTSDSWTFTDTQADSSIIGNQLIYTNGGVIEDVGTSACTDLTVWDTRIWCIFAEDGNLIGYSKTVKEGTPVEMSDLQTLYVSPNNGAQGNTGPVKCLFPMDDKIILFKKNAIYYINGAGPDATGNNSQYSEPIFITSTVGCDNKRSICMTDRGLMFQSDKGIWLLTRDLGTQYIGAAVEAFNSDTVNSANVIPETNFVIFTLASGTDLMYDYYYDEWGSFQGAGAVSATIFQDLHTFVNANGVVAQATPGSYLDLGNPVLMNFTTGWIKISGLQGYQRAKFFNLLGEYLSPHKLLVQIAYDYNPTPTQSFVISPTNAVGAYGSPSPYGQGTPYGGTIDLTREQWRIFLTKQKCQAFQIAVQEIFDPTLGLPAGAGLTVSGINCEIARKKGYVPIKATNSAGG